jgi:hypothetical protein
VGLMTFGTLSTALLSITFSKNPFAIVGAPYKFDFSVRSIGIWQRFLSRTAFAEMP